MDTQAEPVKTGNAQPNRESKAERLTTAIERLLAPLGYEVIHLEIQGVRQKTLRVFIDYLEPVAGKAIGIEDCVKAAKTLDEPLESLPELEAIVDGPYELEVSSPGVDRPLRRSKDFERFSGREVRIHSFRPLTVEELGNPDYHQKNPKQKNFLGTLQGLKDDRIVLAVSNQQGKEKGQKGKTGTKTKNSSGQPNTNSAEEITIPLPLISKANLEPKFDDWNERE